MARDNDKGRGGGRGRGAATGAKRGRPRKNTGVPLDLGGPLNNPITTTTTATPVAATIEVTSAEATVGLSNGLPRNTHSDTHPSSDEPPSQPPRSQSQPQPQTQPPSQPHPQPQSLTQSHPDTHAPTPTTPPHLRVDTAIFGDQVTGSSTQDSLPELYFDGRDCWFPPRIGTKRITEVFKSQYKSFIPKFSMAPRHVRDLWWQEFKRCFRFHPGQEHDMYIAWRIRAAKRLRDIGGSLHTGGSITQAATEKKMESELGRPPSRIEIFERTHTNKKDRGKWVDRRSKETRDLYEENFSKAEEDRASQIASGATDVPPISEDVIWSVTVGGQKRGTLYGVGRVNSQRMPSSYVTGMSEERSTASAPDHTEHVNLLKRELAEQRTRYAELEARYLAEREDWKQTHQKQQQEIIQLHSAMGQMWDFMQSIQSGSLSGAQLPPRPSFLNQTEPTPQRSTLAPDGDEDDGVYLDEDFE
ncbi:hypothetical protein PIB30_068544 [Stylosanthes scabra]|uniref:Transposase, Ptta/En/Spm, plant n=1 Tax=Stylosanthes scabra TaxID=79078 RepID=A0ABU6XMY4_9FABA|nr:hypothetical protein [Stylosanthes scabra]